jgi:hypothetical protein
MIPACDLLAGKRVTSPEESLAAFSTWGAVHGSNASYTRMAPSLVDNHFSGTPPAVPVQPPRSAQPSKRPRAESTTSYDSGLEAGQPIPALTSFTKPRFKRRPPWLRQQAEFHQCNHQSNAPPFILPIFSIVSIFSVPLSNNSIVPM